VPNRANIAALRSLGVRSIIAFSAVGSLRENIPPRDFVLPDQIIDRTKGIRHSTFFGDSIVAHVPFADPFDAGLRQVIINAVASNTKQKLHETGTLVCMEGPAFSTRAESNLYRQWGGDVINMSAIPEAKLAREAEIAYAMVCMSTDYDCWKTDEKPVDVPTVMANMKANSEAANDMIATVLDTLADRDLHGQLILAKHLEGTSRFGCCTARNGMADEAVKKIEWLLPGFFA
jgi:5'-methylthioadenosine phosphorylase